LENEPNDEPAGEPSIKIWESFYALCEGKQGGKGGGREKTGYVFDSLGEFARKTLGQVTGRTASRSGCSGRLVLS
jgi:hypothetical protein